MLYYNTYLCHAVVTTLPVGGM